MKKSKVLKRILGLTTVICLLMTVCPTVSFASDSLVPKIGTSVDLGFNYAQDTVLTENYSFSTTTVGDRTVFTGEVLTSDADGRTGFKITKSRSENYDPITVNASEGYIKGADWIRLYQEWASTDGMTGGRYFTEFKVKFDTLTTMNNLFSAFASYNNVESGGPKLGVTTNTNGDYILYATDKWTNCVLTTGTWYTIKLDINCSTQKYDVYVDGVAYINDVAFTTSANPHPGYNNIAFDHGNGDNEGIYLDDIRIYKQPTGVITYAADDFSTYASDVTYNGSYSSFAGLVGGAINNVGIEAATGKAYFNVAENASSAINWEINKNAQEYKQKSFVLELELNPSNTDRRPNLYIKNKTGEHTLLTMGAYKNVMTLSSASDIIGGANKTYSFDFTANNTYSFKFVIDFNRTYTQTSEDGQTIQTRPGVCDLYLNDVLIVRNAGLMYGDGYSEGEGTGLQLSMAHGDWKRTYLDNFRLYSDEREEVISRLNAEMAAQCANGVVSTDTINLPATYTLPSGNTYNVAWTSSNNTAINPSTGAVNLDKCGGNVALTAKVYYEGEEDLGISKTFNLTSNRFSLDFDYDADTALTVNGYITYAGEISTGATDVVIRKATNAQTVSAADKYLKGAEWLQLYMNPSPSQALTAQRYLTEFKFKMDELSAVSQLFRACTLTSDTGWSQSKGATVGIAGKEDGTYVISAGEKWTSFALAAGEWYNVKADIDTPNKKFDLYVNGIMVANDIVFAGSSYDNAGFNNVIFEHMSSGNVCLDDIRIYKEVKDDAYVIDGCTIEGYKLTSVSVIKNTTVEADLYAAVYNGSMLTDCAIIKNVNAGDHSLDVSVPAGSNVKIFVWSNDGTFTPLMNAYPAQ